MISMYFSIRYLRIGRLLSVKAGIAQLVEQATENRRVPSSNLGPGTIQIRTNLNIKEHLNRCFLNVYSVLEAVLMNKYFI